MKTNSSRGPLFCRRRSQIMVFEGVVKFSAYSSAGRWDEELPNRQGQDWGQAKPAAFASLIILRHRILANGFTRRPNVLGAPGHAARKLAAIPNLQCADLFDRLPGWDFETSSAVQLKPDSPCSNLERL